MGSFRDPARVLLVDGGGGIVDVTGSAVGSFSWASNQPGTARFSFDACDAGTVTPWETNLLVTLGGEQAWFGPVVSYTGSTVTAFTPSIWAAKLWVPEPATLTGFLGAVWADLWAGVAVDGPTVLTQDPGWVGPTVTYQFGAEKRWSDVLDAVGGLVAWAEHGGAIYDAPLGDQPSGVTVDGSWFVESCDGFGSDGRQLTTAVRVFYGPELDRSVDVPAKVDGTKTQTVVEYPEIVDSSAAEAIGREILGRFESPRVDTSGAALAWETLDWAQMIPTTWMPTGLVPGGLLELGQVTVDVDGGCVSDAAAVFREPGRALLEDRIPRV